MRRFGDEGEDMVEAVRCNVILAGRGVCSVASWSWKDSSEERSERPSLMSISPSASASGSKYSVMPV